MADDISVSRSSPGKRRQIRNVRKIATHPRYEIKPNTLNDIAILFVFQQNLHNNC